MPSKQMTNGQASAEFVTERASVDGNVGGWEGEFTPAALGGDDMATLTLDGGGYIRDCDNASEALFGYRRSQLVRQHVSALLPKLANISLFVDGQLNPRLRFLCRIGGYFQVFRSSGEAFASDLFLIDLYDPDAPRARLIVRRHQGSPANPFEYAP